ncbi:MAG: helix-turn-helix transcriptional regulator [Actinomycetota bacterium]
MLAHAAMTGVRRRHETAASRGVGALLDAEEPIPEYLHHALLVDLALLGWASISAAAGHILDRPRDPEWIRLIEAGDVGALIEVMPMLQRRYHAGHATEFETGDGEISVAHVRALGDAPAPSQSLFVAAIQQVLFGACVGHRPSIAVTFSDGVVADEVALATLRLDRARPVVRWSLGIPSVWPMANVSASVERAVLADPARHWTLAAMAGRLSMSRRTLQRRLTGEETSFRSVMLDVRLRLALGLVERTNLSLAEIAAGCGFADQAHLTNRFKRRYGLPPSLHRAQQHA